MSLQILRPAGEGAGAFAADVVGRQPFHTGAGGWWGRSKSCEFGEAFVLFIFRTASRSTDAMESLEC